MLHWIINIKLMQLLKLYAIIDFMNKIFDKKTGLILLLSLIGMCVSLELIYIFIKVSIQPDYSGSFCSINSVVDCDGVAKTSYSAFLGIPLALWGLLLYITIIFLNLVDRLQDKIGNSILDVFKNPKSYIATLGMVSFLISMLLASISIFKINKICALCFVTYFIDLFIAIIAKDKEKSFVEEIKTTVKDFIEGFKNHTKLALVVFISAAAFLTYTNMTNILSPNQKTQKSYAKYIKLKNNPYATSGNLLGKENGEVIIIYGDFLCPFCRLTNIMGSQLASEANVKIIHMNFPLETKCNKYIKGTLHRGACTLSKYALAAKKQGKYWDMVNMLYDKKPKSESSIIFNSAQLGLDTKKLKNDAHSKEVQQELEAQIKDAIDKGIDATPAIEIDSIIYQSAMPYYKLKQRYEQSLARKKQESDN